MYTAFEKLSQEKRMNIINICIEEFGKNGYDNTSTDVITKKAGISKGSIFHYFKSKKNLFLYILNYIVDLLGHAALDELEKIQAEDFFERIKITVLLKQELTFKYINESNFMVKAFYNPPVELQEDILNIYNEMCRIYITQEIFDSVYMKELIDKNKVRQDIDIEKTIKMTAFILEQVGNKYTVLYRNNQFDITKDIDTMYKEYDDYIELIKHGVYR